MRIRGYLGFLGVAALTAPVNQHVRRHMDDYRERDLNGDLAQSEPPCASVAIITASSTTGSKITQTICSLSPERQPTDEDHDPEPDHDDRDRPHHAAPRPAWPHGPKDRPEGPES